jgi:hypothetical protein
MEPGADGLSIGTEFTHPAMRARPLNAIDFMVAPPVEISRVSRDECEPHNRTPLDLASRFTGPRGQKCRRGAVGHSFTVHHKREIV